MHTPDTVLVICNFIYIWNKHILYFQKHAVQLQVLSPKNTPQKRDRFLGMVLVERKNLRNILASAVEAEVGRLFHNYQMKIQIINRSK